MRWDVVVWAAIALLLFAAETLLPNAFMLWIGLAAVAVFLGVLFVPGIPLMVQIAGFVVLTVVAIQVCRTRFARRARQSDPATRDRSA